MNSFCPICTLLFNWNNYWNWKILSGEQIHNCTKAVLFNKLTKNLSHVSTHCIHPPFLVLVWLTTTVCPASALFCRKRECQRKSTCLRRLQTTRWTREWNEGGHFGKFSKPVCLRGFSLGEFFQSNKCFYFSNCDSTQLRH